MEWYSIKMNLSLLSSKCCRELTVTVVKYICIVRYTKKRDREKASI